jgi:hypothetical protein
MIGMAFILLRRSSWRRLVCLTLFESRAFCVVLELRLPRRSRDGCYGVVAMTAG